MYSKMFPPCICCVQVCGSSLQEPIGIRFLLLNSYAFFIFLDNRELIVQGYRSNKRQLKLYLKPKYNFFRATAIRKLSNISMKKQLCLAARRLPLFTSTKALASHSD